MWSVHLRLYEDGRHPEIELHRLNGDVEVDEIHKSGRTQVLQYLPRALAVQAARQKLVAVESDAQSPIVSERFPGNLQYLERNSQPVVDASAIFVVPSIEIW
jgi:hypothetical protein